LFDELDGVDDPSTPISLLKSFSSSSWLRDEGDELRSRFSNWAGMPRDVEPQRVFS